MAYSGAVSGITTKFAQVTNDNLNISAPTPSSVIHIDGAGMDGINDAPTSGGSILGGSSGSDFLIGSQTGNDTFYVDDRNPSQDVWSTLVDFHTGDHATVWGVMRRAQGSCKASDASAEDALIPKPSSKHQINESHPVSAVTSHPHSR